MSRYFANKYLNTQYSKNIYVDKDILHYRNPGYVQ